VRAIGYRELGRRGRLANQLWQIAAAVGVSHTLCRPVALNPAWPYRPFFSCPDDWFSPQWDRAQDVSRYATRYIQPPWHTYCQAPALWEEVEDQIRAAFSPSPRAQAVLDAIPSPDVDCLAVHVRRTDYAIRPEHLPMLDRGYYTRAAVAIEAPGHTRLTYHVYGDDPDWAAEELPERWEWKAHPAVAFGETEDEPTDWLDLLLMARYPKLIVANSSYSWWSAFLAGTATVVAPSPWFGPAIDVASPVMPEWTEVPA
jgi:glycosyl transferase family 11